MSTIQIQKPIVVRTEPRLPTITNKKLVVLPWDWELPSTILKSSWAKQHKQCYKRTHVPMSDKYCAVGILAHYYGWNGEGHIEQDAIDRLGRVIYRDNMKTTRLGHKIVNLNDNERLGFFDIGSFLSDNRV